MKRLTTLLIGITLMLTACGGDRSGSLGSAPTGRPKSSPSSATPTTSPTATPSSPASGSGEPTRTITIQLWFTRAGKVVPTKRTRPATLATSRLALTELVAGPTPAEYRAGMRSAIPTGTTFDLTGIRAGVASVYFPPAFYDGGSVLARLRQAQVVYTLTQFSTVSKVGFLSDVEPAAPVGRDSYAELVPLIVVTSPAVDERVTNPITVTGTANVFEATVSLRLLDSTGRQLATTFTTATCGSGCRGTYSVQLPYRLGTEQRGTLQVYEVSPRDGTRVNVVDLPVVLAAAR